jgi:Domain of unknown function (DUF4159)
VRLRRPQFLLRTLVLLIAVVALALFAAVTLRRAKPKSLDGPPIRGALRVARLMHAGDWNVAPQAIPNLTDALHTLGFGVPVTQKDLFASDPNLVWYPLIYLRGRGAFSLSDEDLIALRRHLVPGGGTLFADATCGDPAFDAAFRRFVAKLLPNEKLVPIPRDDELYTDATGFDLSQCQYTKAAGGGKDYPQLEGVQVNGHWAIVYSKYGIGCVLDRDHNRGCKGYSHDDAVRIGGNVVIYPISP